MDFITLQSKLRPSKYGNHKPDLKLGPQNTEVFEMANCNYGYFSFSPFFLIHSSQMNCNKNRNPIQKLNAKESPTVCRDNAVFLCLKEILDMLEKSSQGFEHICF